MVEEARQRNFDGFVDLVKYISNETDSDVRMVYFWDNAFSPIRNLRMLKSIHKFNHKARKEINQIMRKMLTAMPVFL